MRETFKSGSVGGAPGNRCAYLEADAGKPPWLNVSALGGAANRNVPRDCVARNRGADFVKRLVPAPCAGTRRLTRLVTPDVRRQSLLPSSAPSGSAPRLLN